MRKSIEDGLVDFLAETGIEVVPGVEILLPTRQHSDDQVRELMKARNMEAVLIVSALGQSPEHEGPGSDMDPGSNNRFGLLSGPGYTIQNYGSALKSDLIDVESGRVAWVCTTKRITEGSDKLAPIVMFCLDVKNRLEEDRILK